MKKRVLLIVVSFFVFIAPFLTWVFRYRKPSNDRDWSKDQKVLPNITIAGNNITIKNIRYCKYTTETEYTCDYYDKTFHLDELTGLSYIVESFGFLGSAHTFLSFCFNDNEYVSLSVEIRKRVGQSFSAFGGLLNRNELMYVIADERDIIKLRSNYRKNPIHGKDPVYVYPVKAPIEKAKELLVSMLSRAKKLQEKPEFFNTVLNACTTNIADHINNMVPGRIPKDYRIWIPENADEFAYELGLLDIEKEGTFSEIKKKYYINNRAQLYADSDDFSQKIRKGGS